MKMTPPLWRVVSVWLSVAAVCWCCVVLTESHRKAPRPASSQDIGLQDESGEEIHDHKFEESWALPAHSLSEDEQLIEDDVRTAQEVDTKQYAEASDVEEPDVEVESEADGGTSQPESENVQSSESQHPEASMTQNQESASSCPSHDPLSASAAGLEDPPSILDLHDSIPNSVSDDASRVIDSDPPPADCEDENNPYESDSPPNVLENISNVHTSGTKTHADPPRSSSAVLEANSSHMLKEQDRSSTVATDPDSSVSGKDPEDIPTFDEWKRKVMEVEKEKTQSVHTSNNGAPHTAKKTQKNFNNYASVECGAKVLGANPEAKSTSAILKENMDMYMLNPCSNKIWLVIELCEPIQVKQLDIANFELFSSTPKDFVVSISDRYPTNKWQKLGTFHARDERTVQSFPLDEQLYAKYVKMFTKYIKVELVSHFGSEHFCPLSLIRVFGTSMVEEYEEIADPTERPDDQDDELDPPGYASGEDESSQNLIGSAKDVILNMVNNIAVNVLGGGPEMPGNLSSHEVNVTEPTPQLEATTNATGADSTSVPESEEETILPDPEIPPTVAPPSETPVPETSTAGESTQELPLVEEQLVIPLDEDEEEPISATITILDEEEEDEDEDEDKNDRHEWRQEIHKCCPLIPSFSSCSCAPSLQEYLHQRCSALLSQKRRCQTIYRKEIISPIQKPVGHQPPSPSDHPESQQHHTQPWEREQASEQEPETGASPSAPSQSPQNTVASHQEEPPQLEPSQTSNLLKPSASDSSSAKATPTMERPQLSSERPGKSQDVLPEEKRVEPSVSISSSTDVQPSVGATADDAPEEPEEEKPETDISHPQINTPIETPDRTDQSQILHPTASPHVDHHLEPPAVPDSGASTMEAAHPERDVVTEPEASGGFPVITDTKTEDPADDTSAVSPSPATPPSVSPSPATPPSVPTSPSLSDIYADPANGAEQDGNPVPGASQKESVFMRLNNRIKALEMNMSLSGRYLEQLSQRYRKQMEEMQKAFNKTIIKLQNTSTIAEEQDQRQTESIHSLQGQLENLTGLVLKLSVRVSQLQNEVSDTQNYLLLSLVWSLCLSLLLCAAYCRNTSMPPTTDPEPPAAKSYTYCAPERQLPCDETGLKRSASFPLINADSYQSTTTEGPEMLQTDDTQSLCPANRKRRRRKMKPVEKVETLKPSFHAAPELCNGGVVCNGAPVTTNPAPFTNGLLQPVFGHSEGSSEGSSHSDDPSFCGITTACARICDGLPPPKSRAERRASRRRRPKPCCAVVDVLSAPRRDKRGPSSVYSVHDVMNRKSERSSGTFGVNVALPGVRPI